MKKLLLYIGVAASMLGLNACSDSYLDNSPTDQTSSSVVPTSLNNIYLAVNGLQRSLVVQYGSQGQGGEPGFAMCRDFMGDDITWNAVASWHVGLLQWTAHRLPTSSYQLPWEVYYEWIMNANMILEALEQVNESDKGSELYKQCKGEALCFRGYCHWILVQMYGERYDKNGQNSGPGVPYRLSSGTDDLARSSVKECYDNIVKDLDEAVANLKGITLKVNDYNHCSYAVACGLRARVALTMQDYATAANYADLAIQAAEADGGKLMTVEQAAKCPTEPIFPNITTETGEAMWAAMTQDDQTVYFYSFYAYMSWNFSSTAIRTYGKSISSTTYEAMSETDVRRSWFIPKTSDIKVPASNYKKFPYANHKFTARATSNAVGDYAFMRLSEMYLMKAEAQARNNDAGAAATFTAFQVNRDPEYVAPTSLDALLEDIMASRRVELWGEGFRWLDLKRLNLPLNRTGKNFDIATCSVLQVPAGDVRWQWLLPQAEIDANQLLEQNPLN